MGEYADMAIDYMLSQDEWEQNHPEEVDPTTDGVFRRRRRGEQMVKTCRYCNATPLWWHQHEGNWRLHDWNEREGYTLHVCKI